MGWLTLAARRSGLLADLASRGHELGAHAHGRRLPQAVAALRACGIEPEIAVPGLVQAGHSGRSALLRQSAELGIRVVSDHCETRAWAYEGLMGRWESRVWVISPTVRPPDWGLMGERGERLGVRADAMTRLRRLEAQAEDQGARWFGVAMHEHDFCEAGSLDPRSESLDAFSAFLDRRVQPSLEVCPTSRDGGAPTRLTGRPLSDRRVLLSRLTRGAELRARGRARDLRRALARTRSSARDRPGERVPVGERYVVMSRFTAEKTRAILLMSHAGHDGGRHQGLRPLGLSPDEVRARGCELWLYDRSGTGDSPSGPGQALTPGSLDHVEDWKAVLAQARATGLPVVALSWSSGVIPVLRACAEGVSPDALIDAEGPADRWSLVPPPPSNELGEWDPWNGALWEGLEPLHLLQSFKGPYLRLQGEDDHVHGAMVEHAKRMRRRASELGILSGDQTNSLGRLGSGTAATLASLDGILESIEMPLTQVD